MFSYRALSGRKEKVPISGLLSDSTAVRKSVKRKKGHMARILANKCALAARVDCFSSKYFLSITDARFPPDFLLNSLCGMSICILTDTDFLENHLSKIIVVISEKCPFHTHEFVNFNYI